MTHKQNPISNNPMCYSYTESLVHSFDKLIEFCFQEWWMDVQRDRLTSPVQNQIW